MLKILVLIPFLMFAITSPGDDQGRVESWEGSLQLFGNEPFTRVALITKDQERWFLDLDEQEMNRLWSESRGRIRITGVPVERHFLGRLQNFIKVKSYEWLDNNRD